MDGPDSPPNLNMPETPVPPPDDDDDEEDDEEPEEEDDEDDEESTFKKKNGSHYQNQIQLFQQQQKQDGNTATAALATAKSIIRAVPTLDSLFGHRDLGRDAACWTLSSAKPGNGVDQIRDSSVETYWQSDGSQPHCIQIVFSRRVAVSHVCLYLDYNLDESYTPKKVCIEAGMTLQELQTVLVVDLSEPVGWCILPLEAPPDPLDDDEENSSRMPLPIRTHLIQITILTMHQNGRDTHVRQLKLFGPKAVAKANGDTRRQPTFSTVELSQFSTIR